MVPYMRHKRAVTWPQGCLLVGLRAALCLGDLNHMTLTGRWRVLKILLDAETENIEEAFGSVAKSVCVFVQLLGKMNILFV